MLQRSSVIKLNFETMVATTSVKNFEPELPIKKVSNFSKNYQIAWKECNPVIMAALIKIVWAAKERSDQISAKKSQSLSFSL